MQLKIDPRFRVCTLVCALIAFVFGAVSAIVHFKFGHGPDSTEQTNLLRFIAHHKAYWSVLALGILSLLGYFPIFNGQDDNNQLNT